MAYKIKKNDARGTKAFLRFQISPNTTPLYHLADYIFTTPETERVAALTD
jgi:hypothetical protein